MEIKKLILTMSFPIMISMLVQALYNIVDSMFIARVSEDALAAVSLCYPVQMVMVAVACGTGVGINALLSRYLGEKKQEKASRVAMHGLFCALCNWIVFALIGIFSPNHFCSCFPMMRRLSQWESNTCRSVRSSPLAYLFRSRTKGSCSQPEILYIT